jgi:hypothetical protein
MVLAGRYFTSFGLVMALMLPGLSGQGSAGAQVRPAKAQATDLPAYSPTKVAWLLGVASGKVVTDVVTGDVPAEREGRGITPEAVIEELTGAGFELINRVENWEYQGDRYCLVFRRKPDQ